MTSAAITVNFAAETLFNVGPIGITNTLVATFASSILLLLIALYVKKGAAIVPSRSQVAFEFLYEFIYDKMVPILGSEEKARRFFPLIFTTFLFLLIANQFTLIPFVQSIVTPEGVELFKAPTADYSLPIALTLIMWIMANVLAFITNPPRFVLNFFRFDELFKIRSFKQVPMAFLNFFMGLLDIVGEVAKFVSHSTRLFANIFAGEVLVAVITGLFVWTKYFFAVPFLGLSLLSGLVQAFVFAILAVIYLGLAADNVAAPEAATQN